MGDEKEEGRGLGAGGWGMLLLALTLPLNLGCAPSVNGADPTAVPASPTSINSPIATAGTADAKSMDVVTQPAPAPTWVTPPLRQNRIVDSTFDDLKFDMEKTERFDRSMLTVQIEQLLGKKIRIRGYIFPTLRKRGLKQFVLVRDNLECCFGPGAALYDCILVRMQANKTAEYTIRPVTVEGIFRFEEFLGPEGKHLAIFCLDGEGVK